MLMTLRFRSVLSPLSMSTLKFFECLQEIKMWMSHNFFKLNYSKTEVLLISTIVPFTHARNLGVIFDAHLTLDSYIKSITKSTYHQLRNITRIRPFLMPDAERPVHAFVTSRIDYCIICWSTCYISQMATIYPEFSSTCSLICHLVSISQAPFIVCIGCLFSRTLILNLSL